jgi:hypothetical protein
MTLSRTLLEIRTAAKRRADQENSGLVTDPEWDRYINLSYTDLWDRLVRARGFEYFGVKATVNTSAGVETVALPTTFYKLWGVSALINGEQCPLAPLQMAERDDYDSVSGWNTGWPVRYMIVASGLLLRPVPDGIYTITFWHVPHITTLVADGDTVNGINGWEELLEISAAIQARIKEETDTQALMIERQRLEARIDALAQSRDEGEPARVQNTRYRRPGGWGAPWG